MVKSNVQLFYLNVDICVYIFMYSFYYEQHVIFSKLMVTCCEYIIFLNNSFFFIS